MYIGSVLSLAVQLFIIKYTGGIDMNTILIVWAFASLAVLATSGSFTPMGMTLVEDIRPGVRIFSFVAALVYLISAALMTPVTRSAIDQLATNTAVAIGYFLWFCLALVASIAAVKNFLYLAARRDL